MLKTFALAIAALGLVAPAAAQVVPLPQESVMGNSDLIQVIPNGVPSAQNLYISGQGLSGTISGPGMTYNYLIGGKADQNLWQRATTGSSVNSTTTTFGGPDRWFYWGQGTGSPTVSAFTVSKVSTAAALPTGSQNVFRMQRTASQTGLAQLCMGQTVLSANSYYLAGKTAILDFNFYTGANFSATSMNAYVVYGTGTNEGASKMAFTVNGGGATGWAGGTIASSGAISGLAVSTAYKGAVVASIPSTATEVGVALCYTPTGTAGTTDAIYFDNIELRQKSTFAPFVNSATGYLLTNSTITATINGQTAYAPVNDFATRSYTDEQNLQLAYFWQINEPAASIAVSEGGTYYAATTCGLTFAFPVTMVAAPTVSFGGTALSASTFAIIANSATPIALASTWLVQSALGANTVSVGSLTATTASKTAGFGCYLVGAGGGANIQWSAEF